MGDWMTVHVTGKCDAADVPKLRAAIDPGADWKNFGPLSNSDGMAGLNDWSGETIDRTGNLAERNYTVEQVAEHLRSLVEAAPSLLVRIDCGGPYETLDCIATVMVGEDGSVAVLPPQTDTIPDIPEGQMKAYLDRVLSGGSRW